MEEWTKTIPQARDRWQSTLLVWSVGLVLGVSCLPMVLLALHPIQEGYVALRTGIVSLTFGLVVWALRAATPAGAFLGTMLCWRITFGTVHEQRWPEVHSGLMPLLTLFLLTFLATKAGKRRKRTAGTDELRRGRRASQVAANLGAAGFAALLGFIFFGKIPEAATQVMVLGALAEAAADTVASEIGAAFGGTPLLVTTWRKVQAGSDGAISLVGTAAGCLGAALVVAVGVWATAMEVREGFAAWAGGVAGLWLDSLLGATVERQGWIGNDLVNFVSTVLAGLSALALTL